MDFVARFQVNDHQNFEIQIPRFQEKYNVCYELTPEFNEYDIVKVVINTDLQYYAVTDDYLKSVIDDFKENLQLLLDNKLTLDPLLEIGKVGYAYNHATYHENDSQHDRCFGYSLWPASRWRKTFLYSKADTLYLEISPLYRWLYDEPEDAQEFITFEEFMNTYQPVVILEVERSQAQTWVQQSEELQDFLAESMKK